MKHLNEKKIIDSWKVNASPWIKAIQGKYIESRVLVTDQAIVDQIKLYKPQTVLDIGCGEGWLTRELSQDGISVVGIDVNKKLIDKASEGDDSLFLQMEYTALCRESFPDSFDLVVCNFSLLGKESVEHVFNVVPALLNRGGHFVVQTLHPEVSCDNYDYKDGWRKGNWKGFDAAFCNPAPWYFRTVESWKALFSQKGLHLDVVLEPQNPNTGKPASLIMVGSAV